MNKQILTDIVNSILGLSKRKKKEFVELLDDGINGVSEQLNETVEQINQKINNIEPSDFEENDSSKHSFIKNRPFYDYDVPIDTLEFVSEDFDINNDPRNIYAHENKALGFYIKDENNIQLVVKTYQSGSNYTIRLLDTRYKLSDSIDYVYGQKSYNTIVNYYNNIPLTLKYKIFAVTQNNTDVEYDNTNIRVYCRYNTETEKFEFAVKYLQNNNINGVSFEGSARTAYQDGYIYNIGGIIYNLEYYKGKREIENHFKSLDEKYVPDSIKDRITALEQAVIALGGTLS